jgi:hypothetical protein
MLVPPYEPEGRLAVGVLGTAKLKVWVTLQEALLLTTATVAAAAVG